MIVDARTPETRARYDNALAAARYRLFWAAVTPGNDVRGATPTSLERVQRLCAAQGQREAAARRRKVLTLPRRAARR